MEKTVTFTMSESQAEKFEKLLDEFNGLVKKETPSKKADRSKSVDNNSDLLMQIESELADIKKINSNRKKMIWE